jgi:hypothetical protein
MDGDQEFEFDAEAEAEAHFFDQLDNTYDIRGFGDDEPPDPYDD